MDTRSSRSTRTLLALLVVALVPVATAGAGEPKAASAWAAMERLQSGRAISLTYRDGAETSGWLIEADEAALHYFRAVSDKLPREVQAAMNLTRDRWPTILDGNTITVREIRLSLLGVFDGHVKVADHVTVPREEIRAVNNPDHSPVGMTVLGIVGGFVAFGVVAGHMDYPGPAVAALMFVGMPTAGGIAGYMAGRGKTLYRAPVRTGVPLDEATMRRILDSMPPSLRGSDAR